MKIDTKIILFEKIEALIILLFITILVTSFILLLFFNIFYLSDFIRMGIFLFICSIFIVGYALVSTAFEERIEYYKEEKLRLCQYGTNKKYESYLFSDINVYPEVACFKIAGFARYNSITITDKFLDTGINIVNIIKKYIPEANEKLLSNILSYINKNYTKRMNKDNHSIMLDVGTKYGRMQVKFENEATVLFFTVSQIYGYGNIERTYEMQQVYEIITNNNELLHEIKELNLSSIFLYEVPLPWDPDYIEVEDEESDELYKLKYYSIEEVFNTIANPKYAGWKEYVLNFFTEFDKLSYEKAEKFLKLTEKAEKFLKLTSYPVPEEWYDMLMNKKYLKYIENIK